MERLTKSLRALGPIGSFIANILSALTTNWVVTMTTLISIYAGASDWVVDFTQNPNVRAAIFVFLVLLWTYIGLTFLVDRRRPRLSTPYPDYRYGLVFEGFSPLFTPLDAALPHPGSLMFAIVVRNFSSAPIKYSLDSYDLRIGSRTTDKFTAVVTAYLARGSARNTRGAGFLGGVLDEFFGKGDTKGTADFAISYGPPDGPPVRRLRVSLELHIAFPKDGVGQLGYADAILSEIDEPIG